MNKENAHGVVLLEFSSPAGKGFAEELLEEGYFQLRGRWLLAASLSKSGSVWGLTCIDPVKLLKEVFDV